ncbi:MAG: hypothetical protein WDN46_06660 [Methylocella sp.]
MIDREVTKAVEADRARAAIIFGHPAMHGETRPIALWLACETGLPAVEAVAILNQSLSVREH